MEDCSLYTYLFGPNFRLPITISGMATGYNGQLHCKPVEHIAMDN